MQTYEINVRAVVTATSIDHNESGEIDGWEIYDFDALERKDEFTITRALIRCDQSVTVEADDQETAVEAAKNDATPIVVKGFEIDSVDLWVDEAIDITLVAPSSAPATPSI